MRSFVRGTFSYYYSWHAWTLYKVKKGARVLNWTNNFEKAGFCTVNRNSRHSFLFSGTAGRKQFDGYRGQSPSKEHLDYREFTRLHCILRICRPAQLTNSRWSISSFSFSFSNPDFVSYRLSPASGHPQHPSCFEGKHCRFFHKLLFCPGIVRLHQQIVKIYLKKTFPMKLIIFKI